MNTTTDGALAWLLSLSATCASSPANDVFADWLPASSSPFQDFSSSSQDLFLNANSPSPLSPSYRLASPAVNDLQISPFASYLGLYDPPLALPSLPFSDVSPVVRASHNPDESDKENHPPKMRKMKCISSSTSFLEKLQSAPPILQQHRPATPLPAAHLSTNLDLLDASSQSHLVLLSPVKLPGPSLHISPVPAPVFTTPPRPTSAFLSPLSPLTPLSSPHPLKIKITLKRKNADPTTPFRTTKRPRRTCTRPVQALSSIEQDQLTDDEGSPPAEEKPTQHEIPRSVYPDRTLPTDIEISSAFPLLYRRFPVSTYYQPPNEE